MQRTKKPTFREPGLPNIRECAGCGDKRPIVTHDLCDRCRKREAREENKLNVPALGNKQVQQKAFKYLGILTDLMNKVKAPRANRERVLQELMPYFGFSPETQIALIRDMTGAEYPPTESEFTRVHSGSSEAPPDGKVRTPKK